MKKILRATAYFPNGNDIIWDYSLLIKKVAILTFLAKNQEALSYLTPLFSSL